jgi:hypothetical protein
LDRIGLADHHKRNPGRVPFGKELFGKTSKNVAITLRTASCRSHKTELTGFNPPGFMVFSSWKYSFVYSDAAPLTTGPVDGCDAVKFHLRGLKKVTTVINEYVHL